MKDKDLFKSIDKAMSYNSDGLPTQVTGWCSRKKAHALAKTVVETRPQVTVEIGVWGGASLFPIALAHDHLEEGHCYGVDPWSAESALAGVQEIENLEWWSARDYEGIFHQVLSKLLDLQLTDRCTIFRATSERAHAFFNEIDLLHIDGNHSEASSVLDVFLYLPKVRKGGYVYFDDINWHSTQNSVRLVEERCEKIDEIVSDPGGVCAVYRVR